MSKHKSEEVSPLITTTRLCPLCQQSSQQLQLIPDAFSVKNHDSLTLRPVYEWKLSTFAVYFPELYSMMECPSCGYCSDIDDFVDPTVQTGMTLPVFTKKAMAVLKDSARYRQISQLLPPPPRDTPENEFRFAIRRFWLAIALRLQIPMISQRNALQLARYCLHLAWLLEVLENKKFHDSTFTWMREHRNALHELDFEVPIGTVRALAMALKFYDLSYYNSDCLDVQHNGDLHVLQITARLNLRLKNPRPACEIIFKCIKTANQRILDLKKQLSTVSGLSVEFINFMGQITALETFIGECRSLLEYARKLLPHTRPDSPMAK